MHECHFSQGDYPCKSTHDPHKYQTEMEKQIYLIFEDKICITRGIPNAAYQVLHVLSCPGGGCTPDRFPLAGVPPVLTWLGEPTWGTPILTWLGYPLPSGPDRGTPSAGVDLTAPVAFVGALESS